MRQALAWPLEGTEHPEEKCHSGSKFELYRFLRARFCFWRLVCLILLFSWSPTFVRNTFAEGLLLLSAPVLTPACIETLEPTRVVVPRAIKNPGQTCLAIPAYSSTGTALVPAHRRTAIGNKKTTGESEEGRKEKRKEKGKGRYKKRRRSSSPKKSSTYPAIIIIVHFYFYPYPYFYQIPSSFLLFFPPSTLSIPPPLGP